MFGKRLFLVMLVPVSSVVSLAPAAELPPVPFEARLLRDTLARSGNGERFYATNRLKQGDRVVVRRIVPGGWVGIEPPPGSFSWIRSQYVEKMGARGTVTADNVVVRVGSELGDHHEVEQIRLFRGDIVEILGEQLLVSDGRRIPMYKIRPPGGELRWLPAGDIVPLDPVTGTQIGGESASRGTAPDSAAAPGGPPQTAADPFAFDGSQTAQPGVAGTTEPEVPVSVQGPASPDPLAFRSPVSVTPSATDNGTAARFGNESSGRPSAPVVNTPREHVETRPVLREPPRRDPFADAPIDPFTAEHGETSMSPPLGNAADASPSEPTVDRQPEPQDTASASATTVDAAQHTVRDRNLAGASVPSRSDASRKPPSAAPTARQANSSNEPDEAANRDWLRELEAIDGALKAMLQRPKSQWVFEAFERRYRTLQAAVPHQSVKRLIALRLRLLEHYREEKRAYDAAMAEFRRIVEETDRRNAELARRRVLKVPAAPGDSRHVSPDRHATTSVQPPQRVGRADPADRSASAVTTVVKPPARSQSPAAPARSRSGFQFDGAGVLQRSATRYPGAPAYVLLAPNGRILTYLRPDPRINLERYVGRAVGVFGPRRFVPELQADLLDVKGVMPVRLQTD